MATSSQKSEYDDEDLDGTDFSSRNLVGVVFRRCRIRRANFSGSDLSYAQFVECDLYESKFDEAVLYFCAIRGSDATKASFCGALLNGIRIKDTDITHVEFGEGFVAGANRKWQTYPGDTRGFLVAPSGAAVPSPSNLEARYNGIANPDTKVAIQFVVDPDEQRWRSWRRRAEVAKTVERALNENGYKDRSLDAYYLSRYYLTRADRWPPRKVLKWLFLELVWGYGVRVWRPVLSIVVLTAVFAAIYSALPLIDASSGLAVANGSVIVPFQRDIDWVAARDVIVFSAQASSLSVYGDVSPIGIGKLVGLVQTLASVVMIGLSIAAITRRLGNI